MEVCGFEQGLGGRAGKGPRRELLLRHLPVLPLPHLQTAPTSWTLSARFRETQTKRKPKTISTSPAGRIYELHVDLALVHRVHALVDLIDDAEGRDSDTLQCKRTPWSR